MSDTMFYYLKFMLMFFGLLAVIYVITLITPILAKKIDAAREKKRSGSPERVKDEDLYKVRGIYDAPGKHRGGDKNNDNGDMKDE